MNRYANSLKYDYATTDPINRANQYMQSIASYINKHTGRETVYKKHKGYKKLDVVSQLIKSVGVYKYNLPTNSITNHSLITCHGKPTFVMKTVPPGYTLVMITPHNRIGLQNVAVDKRLEKMMTNKDEIDKFIKNPICYDKNTLDGLFSHAAVYFENQFYFDVFLSGQKQKHDITKMGIYKYNVKDENIGLIETVDMGESDSLL